MRPSSGKLFLLLSITAVSLVMLGLGGTFTSTAQAQGEGWLGVSLQDLNPRLREAMELDRGVRGALVNSVTRNSPADKAGIRDGDVVVEVDDKKITSVEDLVRAIRGRDSGDKVLIVVQRDGRQRGLTATLGTRDNQFFTRDPDDRVNDEVRDHLTNRRNRRGAPRADRDEDRDDKDRNHFTYRSDDDEDGDDRDRHFTWKSDDDEDGDDEDRHFTWKSDDDDKDGKNRVFVFKDSDGKKGRGRVHVAPRVLHAGNGGFLGVSTMNLGDQLAEYFQVPAGSGALVTQVVEDSPAEKAGLKAGDVILSVGGKKVDGPGELRRAIRKHDPEDSVKIEIQRDGERRTINATLARSKDFGSLMFAPEDGHPMVLGLDGLDHIEMLDLENLTEHLENLGEHIELENLGEHLKDLKLHKLDWGEGDIQIFMDDMDHGEWREKLHKNMKGLKGHLKDMKIQIRDHRKDVRKHREDVRKIRHQIRSKLRNDIRHERRDRRVEVVI